MAKVVRAELAFGQFPDLPPTLATLGYSEMEAERGGDHQIDNAVEMLSH